MPNTAVLANIKDNVATAVKNLCKGQEVVISLDNQEYKIVMNGDVPFGHKFAVKEILSGSDVIKYGESIGSATFDIKAGDYVHVHNIESKRARGDLEVYK